jgi:hypothetical protein
LFFFYLYDMFSFHHLFPSIPTLLLLHFSFPPPYIFSLVSIILFHFPSFSNFYFSSPFFFLFFSYLYDIYSFHNLFPSIPILFLLHFSAHCVTYACCVHEVMVQPCACYAQRTFRLFEESPY